MSRRQLMGLAAAIVLVLAAVVAASCGSSDTTTTTGAPATTATTAPIGTTTSAGGGVIDAAALYATNCAGCHEDIPGGDAAEIKSVIESGKGTMPGYKDKLTADEITALVDYVTSGGQE